MRILFIVPYMPNLIRVRSFNLLKFLSERDHQISLLTLYENEAEKAEIVPLKNYCQKVVALPLSRLQKATNLLKALPGQEPLQTAFTWQPQLSQRLGKMVSGEDEDQRPFDIIHIEHLRGVRYGLYLQKSFKGRNPPPPLVWDSVDCISHLFRQTASGSQSLFSRWIAKFELGRTVKFEKDLIQKFSQVLVTSPEDKKAFLSLSADSTAGNKISVLPNGVNLEYFQPDKTVERENETIVISGKMSYHANVTMTVHFIENIMPRVWFRHPNVKVLIVGKDPKKSVQALGQHPNVTVTGTVPDIRPYLNKATIAAAPITYGAGIQNKVLEAMACATPTITTSQAISALSVTPGHDLEVADDPETFSESLSNLLENPEKRQSIGQAGRNYIEEKHNWKNIAANLEEIYGAVIR